MKNNSINDLIIKILAISIVVFHLYTGLFGLLPMFQQRAIHIGLVVSLVLLVYPSRVRWLDMLAVLILTTSCIFVYSNYLKFSPFMVRSINNFEITLGILTTIIILEASRRTTGLALPIVAFLGFFYSIFGNQFISGYWGPPKIVFSNFITHLYFGTSAIWGSLTGLSASYIALFIIFGSLFLNTGAGKTLMDLSKIIAGRFVGGPAKVAVVSSSFFAMLSGSATANVATTGAFTIPLMKSLGYKSEFAGAVEATASTGGIITPPIMGSAGFIIAEFLGVPYVKVMIPAFIPAILFYLNLLLGVHFRSIKKGLKPLPNDEIPKIREVLQLKNIVPLFAPIILLLFMIFRAYSLTLIGALICIVVLITHIFQDFSPNNIIDRSKKIPYLFSEAGKALITIPAVLVAANIVLFMLQFAGVLLKFSNYILSLSGGNLFGILILTAFLVMILGMGLPSAPAYILGFTAAGYSLISLGLEPLSVHLFILYYAILCNITPPVCGAVFVASSIANANWLKCALLALTLAVPLYILPFAFIYRPSLLLIGTSYEIVFTLITTSIGSILLISGVMAYLIRECNFFERILLILAGLGLIFLKDLVSNIIILVLAILVVFYQIKSQRRDIKILNT